MKKISPQEDLEFIFNSLYKQYKKHEIYRKEYCSIIGISDRTLKRRIDSGSNRVATFDFDEDTGRYSWKLLNVARYLVGKSYFVEFENSDKIQEIV